MFGLFMMWVHLYQARAPTREEVVKQLTPLPFTGPDCPYTLVQLNGDASAMYHSPKEGHLSVQVVGGTSNATCIEGSVDYRSTNSLAWVPQIVYPVGLNGCEVPVIASLPEPMARGVNLLSSKPIYLKVGHPAAHHREAITQSSAPLGVCPPSILIASPVRPPPPEAEGEVSMTMEVRELLS